MEGTLRRLIRTVPDFPKPGIAFQDLTPVLADGAALRTVAAALTAPYAGGFDVVAGIEARGFPFAAAAAALSGTGVLLIRKPGKLPGERLREDYALEYGTDGLEVHLGQVPTGSRVLLVDDVLATGGTLGAGVALVERAGWSLAGIAVVLEIAVLDGRRRLPGRPVHALLAV